MGLLPVKPAKALLSYTGSNSEKRPPPNSEPVQGLGMQVSRFTLTISWQPADVAWRVGFYSYA